MSDQIIQQPDGLYAVFSSITDSFEYVDGSKDEVIEYFAKRAATRARAHVTEIFAGLAAGGPKKVYRQFAMTWDEAAAADAGRYADDQGD